MSFLPFGRRSFWQAHFVKCCIAGCHNDRDGWGHHIIHRGAGGPYAEWNRLRVCRVHHTKIHAVGEQKFIEFHPEVKNKIANAHDVWDNRGGNDGAKYRS